MKLLHKFLGSSAIVVGLVALLMGGSTFVIRGAEIAQEVSREKTSQALQKALALQLTLEKQTSALKNFLLLNRNTSDMTEYHQAMSNFLLLVDELDRLMPEATEPAVVRQRHQFLVNLANELENNTKSTQAQSQQDVKAINSFGDDIALYLDLLVGNAQKQYNQTQQATEQFKQTAQIVTYSAIALILLIFVGQFLLILLPVIRSIQKLQLGAAKIGSGNLDYRLEIKTGDEIEQLSHEFNQMSAKLNEFYRCLEEKVIKRTNELSIVNESLKSEISDRKQAESKLQQALEELQEAQIQLIQTEKMSSLGQLVAGVAHEINNPINFIFGNINHLGEYTQNLLELVYLYNQNFPKPGEEVELKIEEIDLEFLSEDLPKILTSMKMGANRIREIVLSLRNFSRLDEAEMKPVDIHEGIDNTLLILQNRLKAKPEHPEVKIVKEYGDLPLVECYPGQLNQVFMNIINNAIDALEDYHKQSSMEQMRDRPSTIVITTNISGANSVTIKIADNGPGIPEKVRQKLFDPFFTTKAVGKGTGLGLSISYQIITEKHRGTIRCISEPGQGAEFWIEIPLRQEIKLTSGLTQLI
ncbi:MAG: HAMP domain-containing protein [Chlorogloeopsis fritschii C42_A2020_084]|uniref:sensor histidine kinase n=1 Tax=Chlorogloeopsis fritschii TaxID=1124 RepID=UPI0019E5958D|nr:ATP-binding protein [Chlorogloeopsis fritschii]MBF2005453.1 HAMP domain-containing protein [Chlorogloeopsis fritschii C42_A2020_084]